MITRSLNFSTSDLPVSNPTRGHFIIVGIRVQAGYQTYRRTSVSVRLYVFNKTHFTSDNTSPNTNPKILTTLNLTLNDRKDANFI